MRNRTAVGWALALGMAALAVGLSSAATPEAPPASGAAKASEPSPYRSPVDLVLSADEKYLLTANQTSHTVSLVRVADGAVVAEVPCGKRPNSIAYGPEGLVLVVAGYGESLDLFRHAGDTLKPEGSIAVGFEPYGVAISPDGKWAYVTQSSGSSVAFVDLTARKVAERVTVGPWPRTIALTPAGDRLAVATNGDRNVFVMDVAERKVVFEESTGGINAGQMHIAADGQVYLPWMVYRQNPIDVRNIKLGWVLGTRIGRVRLDKSATREAITLDVPGEAVADPHGLAVTPDDQWIVCAASGTHELLVFKKSALYFQSVGGPGDHIDPALRYDRNKFYRVPLGGRPMTLRVTSDSRRVYVANYLTNEIHEIDLAEKQATRHIQLGKIVEPTLARKGEAIFYDGARSLDQWYSCHSCHWEGGTNAVSMDTMNDGSVRTFKTVLNLRHIRDTGPWTWHGWQTDLRAAMKKSLTETMLGPRPTNEDVDALLAYLDTLETPKNPYRQPDGSLSAAAQRGKQLFESERAGCAECHKGPYFTDGEVHDVGLNSIKDVYKGYNTPSLTGIYNRVRYLHDGRAKTLDEVFTEYHKPEDLGAGPALEPRELSDLIEYLKAL